MLQFFGLLVMSLSTGLEGSTTTIKRAVVISTYYSPSLVVEEVCIEETTLAFGIIGHQKNKINKYNKIIGSIPPVHAIKEICIFGGSQR